VLASFVIGGLINKIMQLSFFFKTLAAGGSLGLTEDPVDRISINT